MPILLVAFDKFRASRLLLVAVAAVIFLLHCRYKNIGGQHVSLQFEFAQTYRSSQAEKSIKCVNTYLYHCVWL